MIPVPICHRKARTAKRRMARARREARKRDRFFNDVHDRCSRICTHGKYPCLDCVDIKKTMGS